MPMQKPAHRRAGHRKHAITVLTGNTAEAPPAPRGLLKSSRDRWDAFWRSDVSQTVDRESDMNKLERWIGAVDEYARALKVFKTARLVKGSTGQPTLNPLAGYMGTLDAQISKAEQEFGMTPLSRLRLGIALGEAHKSLAQFNEEMNDAMNEPDDDERLAAVRALDEAR